MDSREAARTTLAIQLGAVRHEAELQCGAALPFDVVVAYSLGPGDDVTLLGAEGEAKLDAQQVARVAGTISYNILCSISARVRRVYV